MKRLLGVFIPVLLAVSSGRGQPPQTQTASWEALANLKADTPIVIYLKNGGQMRQQFVSSDAASVTTDAGPVARSDISAICLFRPERLWDGTLRGGAIGVGTMLIAVASYDDRGEDAFIGTVPVAFLAGCGLGALFDAGVAKPDIPVFVDTPGTSRPPSLRHWTIRVPAAQLARWLKRERVQLMLKDGTFVRGMVREATETSLQIDVAESSKQGVKGETAIPTSEIGTVIFGKKMGGSTAAAVTGGAIAGFFSGVVAGVGDGSNEAPAVLVGATIGTLVGAAAAGWGIDRMNTREITLIVE
ncbi:MAG: hypothetical protein EHM61_17425 [Acidobacteria bacterium]|nr:MAG: hypothetical protein EHM61_17425 [Acidobacteriota bacterium]